MNEAVTKSPDEIERDIHATRRQIDDTLERFQQKVSPGALLDQAVGYVREGGSDLASNAATMAGNLGRTARDNPVPLALLGIGLAWLALGGRSGSGHGRYGRDGHDHYNKELGPETVSQYRVQGDADDEGTLNAIREGVSRATGSAGHAAHAAGDAGHRAAEGARAFGERVSDAASRAGGKAGDMADEVGYRARSGAEAVGRGASALGRGAKEGLSAARDAVSDTAHATGRYAQEHPLVTGAVLLAAGAAIAALLPRTRSEDRWVGEASDAARSRAEDAARTAASRASAAATAAGRAASDAAKQHGLTPEDAKRAAGGVAEAGADVAKKAARAAEAELSPDQPHGDSSRTGTGTGGGSGNPGRS